ncbi:hypothetical protein JKP88DRAFT_290426 [Tribonema minus]|uniref:IQCH-like ATP-grasp domain-containing protein n=1 Tax=Tribonema minus TaxID=303371 RepID=A0A835YX44_9STRA|nr:hypothetical protein JKP88DRAFT_290426 [Tribonema minus]
MRRYDTFPAHFPLASVLLYSPGCMSTHFPLASVLLYASGCMSPHFPLASVLLYLPGCMRRIRLLVKGRPALLIAGAPGWQDRRLALALGVPLLGPPSGGVGALCATRSGVRSVFDGGTPPGAHELYHEDEVATALAALISAHIDVGRWVIRLECAWQGRGIAFVDTSRVQCVGQLRQERRAVLKAAGGGGAAWHEPLIQLAARERIAQELRAYLPKYATICDGASYRSWAHFARHVARLGCVIEAEADAPLGRPQATLFLPPGGGEPLLLCASEQLLSEGYRPLGWAAPQRAVPARALEGAARGAARVSAAAGYRPLGWAAPQRAVPARALQGAARAVCGALQAQGAVGYATVTFAAFWDAAKGAKFSTQCSVAEVLKSGARCKRPFWDAAKGTKRLWGVGLELGLSDAAAAHMQCSAMLGGAARHLGIYRQAASGSSAAPMCSAMLGGAARHLGVYRQAASGGSAAPVPESTGSSGDTASTSRGEGQLSTAAAPCHVYLSYLYHPQLADVHLGALFKYSRLEGVNFDMQSRHGVLFELLGGLSCGAVAMLASAPSHRDALTRALRGLKFLRQVAGAPPPGAAARGEPAWFLEAAATLALQLQRMKSGGGGGGSDGGGSGSSGSGSGSCGGSCGGSDGGICGGADPWSPQLGGAVDADLPELTRMRQAAANAADAKKCV